MKIEMDFDCTQREIVEDLAWLIYSSHGFSKGEPDPDPLYFWRSQHPTERSVLAIAEDIFEIFYGDSPSYGDDSEETARLVEAIDHASN